MASKLEYFLSMGQVADYRRSLQAAILRLAAIVMILFSSLADAGTIQGLVLGSDGSSKAYVRIDLSGPSKLTTVTNARGQYRIAAPGGDYRARISDQKRRQDEVITIPENGVKAHNFKLKW